MFDQATYLNRIAFHGPLKPDQTVLFQLQQSHLLNVPFENLDIHLGRSIRLYPSALYDKIVTRRRGGYCFELNGLLALLLESLGYSVMRLSASSANDDGSYKQPFEHLALGVRSLNQPDGLWLVDVGWGDGPLEPLSIEPNAEQARGSRLYRLRREDAWTVLEEKTSTGDWLKHYRFDMEDHTLSEFEGMNRFLQTSPESMFTQKRLCTLFRPEGRVTLSDLRLIETRNLGLRGSETRTERLLTGEEEAARILRAEFGVDLGIAAG